VSRFRNLAVHCFQEHSGLLAFCSLLFIGFIAYGNSLPNSFHFDDMIGIVRNPTLRDLKNIPSYFTDPSTFALGRSREWRPVLQISYALNYFMAGLNPTVFRIFNLLFHLGTAFLIFLVVAEICKQSPPKLCSGPPLPATLFALLSGLLFAVHTANSEAVDYIWARSSVLAAFFYLLAFYSFLRGPFSGLKEKKLWHLAGLVCFALGVGTKATAVTLPLTLVLYEFLFLNPDSKNPLKLFLGEARRLKKYIPVTAVLFAYLAVRTFFLPRMFTIVLAAKSVTSFSYLLTQFRAWVFYLRLFLWPHPLLVDYSGFGWSRSLWDTRVLSSLGLVMTILVLAWWMRKTHPLISFFAFWYFIALLPEASFIPLADAVVGYRAYPAYVGLAVVSAMLSLNGSMWIWRRLHRQDEIGGSRFWVVYGSLAGIVLAVLTGATIIRNLDWRDETTLWSDVIEKDPTNPRAYMGLGMQFLTQGDYGKAEEMFEKAVRFGPAMSQAYALRGYLKSRLNKNAEALTDFATAIKLDPRSPYNFSYRGQLYTGMGEADKALDDFRAALALLPFYTDAYLGIAMAHLEKDEIAKATEACAKLVEIDPDDRRGYDCLGTLLMEQKRFPEAVRLYQNGVSRIPQDSELWYSLGTAYESEERYKEAGDAFERAGRLLSNANRQAPQTIPPID
jgi:Tfp pilus assembly protein PilF